MSIAGMTCGRRPDRGSPATRLAVPVCGPREAVKARLYLASSGRVAMAAEKTSYPFFWCRSNSVACVRRAYASISNSLVMAAREAEVGKQVRRAA